MKNRKALFSLAAALCVGILTYPLWAQQAATFWQVVINTNIAVKPGTSTGPTPITLQNTSGGINFQVAYAGQVSQTGLIETGAAPTITGCGSLTTQAGGNSGGEFNAAATSCTPVITPGFTAPNGFICRAYDLTTPADLFTQTATSATTCTLTATVTSADHILWVATAY